MKRDFDLIRRIMIDVQNTPAGSICENIAYPEYDQATVYEHEKLLIDEGFVDGQVVEEFGGIGAAVITGLTWKGHDFLDAAKDDTIWNKVKQTVLTSTVSITFSLLLELLKAEARKKLGLP
jgi:hypothetical protein